MGASGSSPADCNIDDSPIQTTEVFSNSLYVLITDIWIEWDKGFF